MHCSVGSPRLHAVHLDRGRARRIRCRDGQCLQARDQPAARHDLRTARGVSRRRNQLLLSGLRRGEWLRKPSPRQLLRTFTVFVVMLALYTTRIIKVTNRFKKILFVSLISTWCSRFASFIAALFGVGNGFGFFRGRHHRDCILGLVVILPRSAWCLDFDAIEQACDTAFRSANRRMALVRWSRSFGST